MENKEVNYQVETEFDMEIYNLCDKMSADFILSEVFNYNNEYMTCGHMKNIRDRLLKSMYAGMKEWLEVMRYTKSDLQERV